MELHLLSLLSLFAVASCAVTEKLTEKGQDVNSTVISERTPRRLLHKVHSGIAFLTGFKLGSALSKPWGLQMGHGSLSSSNSFKIFGKSVNSALSVSYGDYAPFLPGVHVHDVAPAPVTEEIDEKKISNNILHVTVIENPSADALDKLKEIADITENDISKFGRTEDTKVDSTSNTTDTKLLPNTTNDGNFFAKHNKRVEELNQQILGRKNNKF